MKLTYSEIEKIYGMIENKSEAIKLLAEINDCTKQAIADCLEFSGVKVDRRCIGKVPATVISDQTAKQDTGKPRLSLVPLKPIAYDIAHVREFGCIKYTPDNWKTVEPARIKDAAARHFVKWMDNAGMLDEESGLPHRYHLETNLSFLAWMEDRDGIQY